MKVREFAKFEVMVPTRDIGGGSVVWDRIADTVRERVDRLLDEGWTPVADSFSLTSPNEGSENYWVSFQAYRNSL
jgi:hypothetical protein